MEAKLSGGWKGNLGKSKGTQSKRVPNGAPYIACSPRISLKHREMRSWNIPVEQTLRLTWLKPAEHLCSKR